MQIEAQHRRGRTYVLRIAWLVLAYALGCESNNGSPYTTIGLACRDAIDCPPGVSCEHGKQFGDGTCTYACRDHLECPGGAACVDVNGGSCLVACVDDSWCQPGYHCKKRDDRNGPGQSFVCVK